LPRPSSIVNPEFKFHRRGVPAERRSSQFPAFCRKPLRIVAMAAQSGYLVPVKGLTKQEQLVLCIVLGLLLTGWAVKAWRTAHPPAPAATRQVKP